MIPNTLIWRITNYCCFSYSYYLYPKKILSINKRFKFYILYNKNFLDYYLINNCKNNNISRIKYLISLGANPRARDDLSIIWASEIGYVNVAKLLIYHDVDPRARDDAPLLWGLYNNNIDIVRLLISHNANPRTDEAITEAEEGSDINIIRILLSLNVNLVNHDNIKIVRLLKSYGSPL